MEGPQHGNIDIASQQHIDTALSNEASWLGAGYTSNQTKMKHQHCSSSDNDVAADAILSAYIIRLYDSDSPFTPHHPPLQQMTCTAWMRSADEKSSSQNAS